MLCYVMLCSHVRKKTQTDKRTSKNIRKRSCDNWGEMGRSLLRSTTEICMSIRLESASCEVLITSISAGTLPPRGGGGGGLPHERGGDARHPKRDDEHPRPFHMRDPSPPPPLSPSSGDRIWYIAHDCR